VPVIGTQELTTTVTVPNRQTVILGGLITEQEERTQTGIPYLRDIPGLGYLFASTKKDVTRRELIILIQPFIIDAPGELEEANEIERANSSLKNEAAMFQGQVPVKKALLPDIPGAPKRKPPFPVLQNP
jgi:type II secretory pathway component GspD/PulD (secretin)